VSQILNLRLYLFFIIGLSLPVVMARPVVAQDSYVEGVSAILASTNASEIDTYSSTYLTPDIAYYYSAYVEGYLFQNGTQD
jgi:hypothetical protein